MSFEKKMKKRGNQKLDAFAKNPYHQEIAKEAKPVRRGMPLWSKILIPLGSITVAVFGTFLGMRMVFGGRGGFAPNKDGGYGDNAEEAQVPGGASDYQGNSKTPWTPSGKGEQTTPTRNWDEADIIEKYPEFTYLENQYYIRYVDSSEPISSTYINTKLADITVEANAEFIDEGHPSIEAELYSIKNIALDASIAIKFNGSEDYYAYQNIFCYFANLGELVDKISFHTEVKFPEIYYHHYDESNNSLNDTFNNVNEQEVMNILFSDLTIVNQKTKQRLNLSSESSGSNNTSEGNTSLAKSSITLLTEIKCLGIDNAGLQLYENGVLHVNLFGSLAEFIVGESVYQSLVSYHTNN